MLKLRNSYKKNKGVNLHGLGLGDSLLATTPKAQTTKEKIDKLDFIKLKLLHFKGGRQESKKKPTVQEKILANYISAKGVVSRKYKHHSSTMKRQITES